MPQSSTNSRRTRLSGLPVTPVLSVDGSGIERMVPAGDPGGGGPRGLLVEVEAVDEFGPPGGGGLHMVPLVAVELVDEVEPARRRRAAHSSTGSSGNGR